MLTCTRKLAVKPA